MVHSSSSSSSSTHLLPLPSLPPLYALYTLYTLESLHTLYTLYTLYTLCTQCVQCVHHVYSVQCVQCAQCVQCVQNAQSAQNVQCVQCAQCVYSVYSLAMGPQYSGFVLFALPLLHEPMNCRLRTFELNCLTAYCFFSQPNCVLFNCPVTVGTTTIEHGNPAVSVLHEGSVTKGRSYVRPLQHKTRPGHPGSCLGRPRIHGTRA